MAISAFGMLIAQHVSSPTHLFFIADKHHELSGGVLSPLHPAHPLRLVQETKRAGRGAARVPTQGQHQVQEVRQSVQKEAFSPTKK